MSLQIGNGINIVGGVNITIDPGQIPTNTSVPVISGTAQYGQVLTTTTGIWDAAPKPITYNYQWLRGAAPISGATSNSYTITVNDIGYNLQSSVQGVNALGSNIAYSANTSPVIPLMPAAPTGVTAASYNSTTAFLTWTPPSDPTTLPITSYYVEINKVTAPASTTYQSIPAGSSGYVTGLTTGSFYNFRIASVNGAGQSPYSSLTTPNTQVVPAIGESYGGGRVIATGFNSATICSPLSGGTSTGTLSQIQNFCNALVLNGYSDWFAPSLTIMQQMQTNRTVIGGYTSGEYWTTTVVPANPSLYYTLTMPGGVLSGRLPTSSFLVRAVRNQFYP